MILTRDLQTSSWHQLIINTSSISSLPYHDYIQMSHLLYSHDYYIFLSSWYALSIKSKDQA